MDPREITYEGQIEVMTPRDGPFATQMSWMLGTPEPSMMTPGKGQKRDASSDLENTIPKQLCLDEEVLIPGDFGLSPIATPEGSSGKVRIPQEGSYVDLGEEDFTEVTKRNRKTHGTKNAAAFDFFLIELGFNDTSTLVGHFVSSPREREKKDRRDSRGDEREGQGRKRNRNESEETEEIKTSPSTLTCYKDSRPCPAVSQYQLGAPVTPRRLKNQ